MGRLLADGPPRSRSTTRSPPTDRAGAAGEAARARSAGFRCVKVKVGIGDDAGRIAAVRAAAGPEIAIRLDANGAWTVSEADAALRALEPAGIELCEEAVTGVAQTQALSALSTVPLAIDETAAAPGALDERVCDAVCLKIARCGGITGLLDAARRARAVGYEVYIASTLDGPLGIAAALHAAAALEPDRPCGLATLELFADRGRPAGAARGPDRGPRRPRARGRTGSLVSSEVFAMSGRSDFAVVGAGIVGLAVARELLHAPPGITRHGARAGATVGVAPEQPQQRRDPRRRLLPAGIAEGAAVRRGRGTALRLLRAQRNRREEDREADHRDRPARASAGSTSSSAGRARTGCLGSAGWPRAEIAELEPHATGVAALHSPHTGIVDFRVVCERLADDVREAGGELRLDWRVDDVREQNGSVRLLGSEDDAVEASGAVFCAGLWSDRLAVRAGGSPDPRVVPFRGGYLRLRHERRELVHGMIYPVPDAALPFLGVHLTPHVDGEVLLGPSALLVGARDAYRLTRVRFRDVIDTLTWPGSWRMGRRWWQTGLREIHTGRQPARVRRGGGALRARAAPGRPAARLRRGQGPGRRARRPADRRLRRLIHSPHRPRPQRPLPRRHLLARARLADRRHARAAGRVAGSGAGRSHGPSASCEPMSISATPRGK